MNILVVFPYFYPHLGGTQRYIEELYGSLRKQHKNVSVDVLTYNTEHVEEMRVYQGMRVYRVKCIEILRGQFALPNLFDLVRVARKMKKNGYDVVNTHARFFDSAWWGWLLAKYLGAKSVLTDHCASHPKHPNWIVEQVALLTDKLVIPLMGRIYDGVTVVSKATGRFLHTNGLMKSTVIPGGVTQVNLTQIGALKQHKQYVRIVFVGRMIPAKGPLLVMKAAEQLIKGHRDWEFLFLGGGPLVNSLKACESKQIRVLGSVSKKRVAAILQNADILVHPSLHHEGLPSVILEAGLYQCAVLATRNGGVGEIIKHRETGLIIKPTETSLIRAIELVANDKRLRIKLARGLHKKIVKDYSWNMISEKYYSFIEKLLTDKNDKRYGNAMLANTAPVTATA